MRGCKAIHSEGGLCLQSPRLAPSSIPLAVPTAPASDPPSVLLHPWKHPPRDVCTVCSAPVCPDIWSPTPPRHARHMEPLQPDPTPHTHPTLHCRRHWRSLDPQRHTCVSAHGRHSMNSSHHCQRAEDRYAHDLIHSTPGPPGRAGSWSQDFAA